MCGRFGLDLPPRRVAETFDLDDEPNIQARYNIAPSQLVAAVMVHPQSGKRVLRALAWGLLPAWAKDAKGKRPINARAETVRTKPAFREAFAARRCILPASHFFEWRMSADGSKTPHCIRLAGGEPMALAAIWESWRDPAAPDAAVLFTCARPTSPINCRPNSAIASPHPRSSAARSRSRSRIRRRLRKFAGSRRPSWDSTIWWT